MCQEATPSEWAIHDDWTEGLESMASAVICLLPMWHSIHVGAPQPYNTDSAECRHVLHPVP